MAWQSPPWGFHTGFHSRGCRGHQRARRSPELEGSMPWALGMALLARRWSQL